jgi:hypothetical protein
LASGQQTSTVTIGFLTDGSYQRHTYLFELLQGEINDLLSGEFDVRMPADATVEADFTVSGIEEGLDRLLDHTEVDLIVTFGAISSHLAAIRRDLAKPVVAAVILDPDLQGVGMAEGGGSGIRNLSYIALPETDDIPG